MSPKNDLRTLPAGFHRRFLFRSERRERAFIHTAGTNRWLNLEKICLGGEPR